MFSLSPEFISIAATVICLGIVFVLIFAWNQNFKELLGKTEEAKDLLSSVKLNDDEKDGMFSASESKSKSKKKRSRKKNKWGEMGRIYFENGDLDSSLDALDKAIAADSQDYSSLFFRCNANFKKFEGLATDSTSLDTAGQFLLKSLQDADSCIKLDPGNEEGYLCKISILLYIDELPEALKTCRHGLRNIPNSKPLKSCKARINKALSPSGQLERMAKQKRAAEQKELNKTHEVGACAHNHAHDKSCLNPLPAQPDHLEASHKTLDHSHVHSEHCSPGHADAGVTSDQKSVDSCASCGSLLGLKACGRCKKVFYCGVECQKKDLKSHKEFCKSNAQK